LRNWRPEAFLTRLLTNFVTARTSQAWTGLAIGAALAISAPLAFAHGPIQGVPPKITAGCDGNLAAAPPTNRQKLFKQIMMSAILAAQTNIQITFAAMIYIAENPLSLEDLAPITEPELMELVDSVNRAHAAYNVNIRFVKTPPHVPNSSEMVYYHISDLGPAFDDSVLNALEFLGIMARYYVCRDRIPSFEARAEDIPETLALLHGENQTRAKRLIPFIKSFLNLGSYKARMTAHRNSLGAYAKAGLNRPAARAEVIQSFLRDVSKMYIAHAQAELTNPDDLDLAMLFLTSLTRAHNSEYDAFMDNDVLAAD